MDAGKVFGDPAGAADRRKFLIVVLLAIAATLVPVHADAKGADRRTVTKQYISGDGGPWMTTGFCDPSWDSYHIGAVCFGAVDTGHVRLTIEDESGRRVGGHAVITDGNGAILHRESFCGTSGPIALQAGALFVHLDGPDSYEPGCPLGALGFATIGRVRATFMQDATESLRVLGRTFTSGRIVSGILTTGPAGTCREMPAAPLGLRAIATQL